MDLAIAGQQITMIVKDDSCVDRLVRLLVGLLPKAAGYRDPVRPRQRTERRGKRTIYRLGHRAEWLPRLRQRHEHLREYDQVSTGLRRLTDETASRFNIFTDRNRTGGLRKGEFHGHRLGSSPVSGRLA